jgi:hypothetical protein
VRHGIDGSGIFQAAESFDVIASMIESQSSLEKPLVAAQEGFSPQVEAEPQRQS